MNSTQRMIVPGNAAVICPGCGWHGQSPHMADRHCPGCDYEVDVAPYRLLSLQELRECNLGPTWNDVDMRAFLRAVAEVEATHHGGDSQHPTE